MIEYNPVIGRVGLNLKVYLRIKYRYQMMKINFCIINDTLKISISE